MYLPLHVAIVDEPGNGSKAAWRAILKEDPEVLEWHAKLGLKKTGTADERGRILYRYCRALKTTPAAIAERAKDQNGGRRAVERDLQGFVVLMHRAHKPSDHGEGDENPRARERCKRSHSPSYVENFVKAVRSWCEHNDITLRRISVGDTDAAPTVENEVPITPEQIREILAAASPRGRVVISLVAFAGLRPESIGTLDASDGLTIEDLPDVELDGGAVSIKTTPLQVNIRRELSKVKRKYGSFLPAEAGNFVRDYFEHRIARGEVLTPKSPVIRPDYNRERQGRPAHMRGSLFLTTQAITSEIRDALRSRRMTQRPYALRSYFIQRLMSAERDGKIAALDRMFFSGRKDAIDLRYSHFKSLSPKTIDELRRSYAACEAYLGAKAVETPVAADVVELQAEMARIRADYAVLKSGFAALMATHPIGTTLEVTARDGTKVLEADVKARKAKED